MNEQKQDAEGQRLRERIYEDTHCTEKAVACCDICDHWFCGEHGSPGGDRQVQGVGAVAYPSVCCVCQQSTPQPTPADVIAEAERFAESYIRTWNADSIDALIAHLREKFGVSNG
jgi:hypothetical protein